jgi:hypothetical protein
MIEPQIIAAPIVLLAVAGLGYARMAFRHREKMASLGSSPATNPVLEARLARIEEAVETIAIEVERMGEGQRFVTKLLAERSPLDTQRERPPSSGYRVTTPH